MLRWEEKNKLTLDLQMMMSEPEIMMTSKTPTTLPVIRRFDGNGASRTSPRTRSTAPSSPASSRRAPLDDISKLPLDARLVPKQLVRAETSSLSPQVAALNSTGAAKKTPKTKKTSEKKQERKAAKTLSAILLAFVLTWAPYSVLVVLNGILGKQLADHYIPQILWEFSYYLCYINSTINPVLYALCNASFRRTYVRILTCRWTSTARQPFNRYYYG